jgi:hypothetical protein
LNYTSDRVPGRTASNILTIALSGATLPASLARIDLEIEVAGQVFRQEFPPQPNQSFTKPVKAASLPERVKPRVGGQAMGNRNRRAFRGERRQPEKVSQLRQKLGHKTKQEPGFRFYALYERIYRRDVLAAAWARVKANKGAANVDGVEIDDLAASPESERALLDEIERELKEHRYLPRAVQRVYRPKANGKLRALGIPRVRDRVVQQAALLILEPIFEADFHDSSFGFRPGRGAHGALEEIRGYLEVGFQAVFDADLKSQTPPTKSVA